MFRKNYLYLSVVILFFSSPSFSTEFIVPEDLKTFNSSTYNALPLSVEADYLLKQNGNITKLLDESLAIANKYGIEEYFGFRLAHRHHDLSENEVMVEQFENLSTGPALITSVKKETSTEERTPASWLYTSSGLKVFEYSTDPQVKELYNKLMFNTSFFEEIRQVSLRLQLDQILAPAILGRQHFQHFNAEQPLYEQINAGIYASILINKPVEEIEKEKMIGGLIQTSWGLSSHKFPILCVTHCRYSDAEYRFHEYYHN